MNRNDDYFARRERIERAAAKAAATAAARRVHQQLAENYAKLAREAGSLPDPQQPLAQPLAGEQQ